MAIGMRDRVGELSAAWRKQGHELPLGVGIAQGYATIGAIGCEGRWDYNQPASTIPRVWGAHDLSASESK